jgi:hypothetical protein
VIKPFALCHGADLPFCRSCERLVDHYLDIDRHQAYMQPHTDDGRCIDHRGLRPAPKERNGG